MRRSFNKPFKFKQPVSLGEDYLLLCATWKPTAFLLSRFPNIPTPIFDNLFFTSFFLLYRIDDLALPNSLRCFQFWSALSADYLPTIYQVPNIVTSWWRKGNSSSRQRVLEGTTCGGERFKSNFSRRVHVWHNNSNMSWNSLFFARHWL